MLKVCRLIIVLLVAIGFAALLPSQSVNAISGVGGRPANPDPENPRSSSIFIYTIDAGSQKNDQVLMSNGSTETQTVQLYAVDATTTNTGSLACRQKVEDRNEVGKWTSVALPEVTLAPGEKQRVDFSVNVPSNASPGEHSGCLVFQQKDDEGEVTGNVRIHTRQAVRIAVIVPGELHKQLELTHFDASANKDGQLLNVTVKNAGNVSADTDVRVQLRDIFGRETYQNGGAYPIFGGNKLDLRFADNNRPFWGGFYTARATVKYDQRPGVFSLEDQTQLITLESPRKIIFIAPAPAALVGGGIGLAAVLIAIAYVLVRRHRLKYQQKHWQTYTVAVHDTLETVAKKHHTTWKKIARVNKLEPPYQIHVGQRLKVPHAKQRTKNHHKS